MEQTINRTFEFLREAVTASPGNLRKFQGNFRVSGHQGNFSDFQGNLATKFST